MTRTAEELLRCRSPHPDPALRLFCLPWAGSGSLGYASWQLPADLAAEVWTVQLPGREDRAGQPPLRRIPDMVEALRTAATPLLDRPFAFFGHSMGALLAFELARLLRRTGGPAPAQLFLSGMRSPDLAPWRPPASTLDEEALLRRLDEMAGPSVSALRDRELLLWLAPVIRADFEACEAYWYEPQPPLDVPVSLLAAVDDVEVRVDEVADWWRHSTATSPVRIFEGGHLYLLDHRDRVLEQVAAELALATAA
ncbi:alpha/beta fold hydrolase [Kitasatospora aureofaciens]|uniref:thioesterase II family protein n=1 Tax=Kitasatospora aureofaciens TaxID=1894 RepID=UPI001DF9FFB7|nr:alpha/beta fold hydrolase [Kitasatospora aureofaciens]HJD81131.1 alpha/beta fold hydrolase [Kitasatospora aureofaciens]